MSCAEPLLSVEDRSIIAEEEGLLERARASLRLGAERAARARRERAERASSDLRSADALRGLRAEAASASEDDLPPLLLEMSVRHGLMQRADDAVLPDPVAPYLAHLRVREGGAAKDYLLGRVSFLDTPAGVRIVDWRVAPVAQIFYRYREGDEYEEAFPGRVAEGVVEARRIVALENGVLTQIVGDGVVLVRTPSGGWVRASRDALALEPGGAGTAARPGNIDVTALLDAVQFAAIAAPPSEPLLVLGSAGSGKTTVALHRLARIAAAEPERYPLSRMRVVVPEEGLARLSRRLLDPLVSGDRRQSGERHVSVSTLDAWSHGLARDVFGARLPALCMDPPALVSGLKRHPALYDALRERLARVAPAGTTLPRLRKRLADVFTDRSFLEGVVERARGDLPRGAVEETIRHTMLQLATPLERELRSITDEQMKRAIDGRAIWEGTPDELAGTLDIEDLPILLFVKAWRGSLDASTARSGHVAKLAHLVLDEAEDFSLFELHVLGALLASPASVTLAGDEAQRTSSSFASWPRALATLGVEGAATCRLTVSHRCPQPVAELARKVLGPLAPKSPARAERGGPPVGYFPFPSESQAHLFLAGAVRDLHGREPRASIGVLARDADVAERFHELVADLPDARLVRRGEFSFEPGVDVAIVDDAKGLEFDYVIVPDATADAYPLNDEARRRLHVAVTRSSHQVWLVSGGRPSRILADTNLVPQALDEAPRRAHG